MYIYIYILSYGMIFYKLLTTLILLRRLHLKEELELRPISTIRRLAPAHDGIAPTKCHQMSPVTVNQTRPERQVGQNCADIGRGLFFVAGGCF